MGSLSSWLRLYCLLRFIVEYNSYVLLAADADDFRNIAKQFVPETLANKLARLASDISDKQKSHGKSEEADYYYESETEEVYEDTKEDSAIENNDKESERSGEEDMYVKEWKTRVNFEELVERVKDRLALELSQKLKTHILNPKDKNPAQSIYNNLDQKKIQNESVKNTATKNINYDYSYNQSGFNTEETYGYNSSNSNRYPKKQHKNFNNYIKADYQGLQHKMSSPHENSEYEQELFENNNDNYQNTQEKHKESIMKNYEPRNPYLITNSKQKKYPDTEIQSNEMNHKEDNSMFHLQNNKALAYDIEEIPTKIQNKEFNKEIVKMNDVSLKHIENDKPKYEESELVGNNYDEGLSKQINRDQNIFVDTDNNKHSLYEEIDMVSKRKNDSYEDYVIPKVENKYASDETTTPINQDHSRKVQMSNNEKSRFKVQYNSNIKSIKPLKNEWQLENTEENVKLTEDYRDVIDKSQEIKAKTESLWYNYEDESLKAVKDDRSKDRDIISKHTATQKSKPKGTMIPTREYFKMASPNYYISLPTVVDKYDSNEPLPEKDREREVIKHFVNPPASINKKVRLI